MDLSYWKLKESSTEAYKNPPPVASCPPSLWPHFFSHDLLTKKQIEDFLSCPMSALTDPFKLKDMDKAVERLERAFLNKETVGIYGDFDMDGTCALVLVKTCLEKLGFKKVLYRQPKRLKEGYGFHFHHVEALFNEGACVLITVDVGVTELETVKKAKKLGMDVILTDHHTPKEDLPEAFAIINPHQKKCSSQLEYLCGTGVGFYLMWALSKRLKEKNLIDNELSLKDVLDCFAIGTLSDVVPLLKDNRILTRYGLKVLEKTTRKGLKQLLKTLNMEKQPLSGEDVYLKITPKLNALSRLELDLLPLDVFFETNSDEAESMIEKVMKYNELRKKHQMKAEERSHALVNEDYKKGFVFVWSQHFHRGVLGIVASRLVDHYKVPSLVAGLDSEDCFVGSVRVPRHFKGNVLDVLEKCKKHLTHFGGHKKACGFGFKKDQAKNLFQSLEDNFKPYQKKQDEKDFLFYDSEIKLSDINSSFLTWYDQMEPFGPYFEAPLFYIKNLDVVRVTVLKKQHFKFALKQEGKLQHALWFFPPFSHSLNQNPLQKGDRVEVIAQLKRNYFRGENQLQLYINDIKKIS